jgi:predicted O-linked N-acetylglucosamine transferase (SPINDLY family)
MGLEDCIAKDTRDYVRLAIELGTDVDRRRSVGPGILNAGELIFSDQNVVRLFEELLTAVVGSQSTVSRPGFKNEG